MTSFLRFDNLTKSYYEGDVRRVVLQNAHAEFQPGEITAIVGKSGSGKSTLLNLISGIDTPDGGQVWVDGRDLTSLHERDRTLFRRAQIGFVFQFHHLLPEFTALQNVMIPALKQKKYSRQEVEDRAYQKLKMLGMQDFALKPSNKLSGGQQQRIAIARGIINDPDIIMGDEPTGNLDSYNTHLVFDIFRELTHTYKQTIIAVTHDKEFARNSDRVVEMSDGKIIGSGSQEKSLATI